MDPDLDLPRAVAGWRFAVASAAALSVAAVCVARAGTPRPAKTSDRLAAPLVAFDQWVLDAAVGATAALFVAVAWTANALDVGVLGAPADAAARAVARGARALRPLVGGSLDRIFWGVVALLALACAGYCLWPAH